MKRPMFSIHIPVYNTEKYLSKCIESVLNQTYQNFEIILTDDGSTDTSGEICDEYARKYDKIKVFHNKNQGLLLTRRFSIKHAMGEYSLFVDSDDFIEPFTLEHIDAIIQEYLCDTVIFHYIRVTDKDEIRYIPPVWNKLKRFENNKKELYEKLLLSSKLNNMCMKAVKTSLLLSDNTNYENYKFVTNSEDQLQSFYIIFNSKTIIYTPTILYNYNTNTSSITNNINKNSFASMACVKNIALEHLKSIPSFNNQMELKYAIFCAKSFLDTVKSFILYSSDNNKTETLKYIKELDFYKNFVFKHPIYNQLDFYDKIIYYLFIKSYHSNLITWINLCAKFKKLLPYTPKKIKIGGNIKWKKLK